MRHGILLLLLVAGCGTTHVREVESSIDTDSPTRRITLGRGDTIAVAADASGAEVVTVTAARRQYTTTAEPLVATARQVAGILGKPGTTVWIRVDEEDRIVAIGRRQAR